LAIAARIPDFARGYGQAVNVWNSSSNSAFDGIPVLLSTGAGVRSVSFTVSYNPALLSIDTVALGTSVAAGSTLSFTMGSPGTINVTVSNATTDLGGANLNLVSLKRLSGAPAVPTSAPYGDKHVLDISGLTVSGPGGAPLASVADDGVHVAAYPGDLNGSRTYNAPDTSFMQQLILNPGSFGLAAYQLADPVLLADINGNGQLQANDAAQIQRLIVSLSVPFVPPRPTGLPVPAAGLDPHLFISTSIPSAAPGQSFTMTLNMLVTEAGGVTFGGVEAGITYDPALFTVTSFFASDWTTGDGFSAEADFSMPGVIKFAASTNVNYLSKTFNARGSLLTATLMINADASAGSTSINLTDAVRGIPTALYDGTPLRNNLLIDPAVTDGWDAGVDARFTVASTISPRNNFAGFAGQDSLSGGADNDLLLGNASFYRGAQESFDAGVKHAESHFGSAGDVFFERAVNDSTTRNEMTFEALWEKLYRGASDSIFEERGASVGSASQLAVESIYGEADVDWYLPYPTAKGGSALCSERDSRGRFRIV
jgi:hypothetical protein